MELPQCNFIPSENLPPSIAKSFNAVQHPSMDLQAYWFPAPRSQEREFSLPSQSSDSGLTYGTEMISLTPNSQFSGSNAATEHCCLSQIPHNSVTSLPAGHRLQHSPELLQVDENGAFPLGNRDSYRVQEGFAASAQSVIAGPSRIHAHGTGSEWTFNDERLPTEDQKQECFEVDRFGQHDVLPINAPLTQISVLRKGMDSLMRQNMTLVTEVAKLKDLIINHLKPRKHRPGPSTQATKISSKSRRNRPKLACESCRCKKIRCDHKQRVQDI